jgi:hypothetical protein
MPDNELTRIPGLLPKHLVVLAEQCQITTAAALVHTDRRTVHAALRRLRPRPGLEEIATWQDHARDLEADVDPLSEWDQVSAFVVSFERRGTAESPERRVAIEQAERTSPTPRSVWSGWGCEAICGWMHEHLAGDPATETTSPAVLAVSTAAAVSGATDTSNTSGISDTSARQPDPSRARRPRISVDHLMLIDANGMATELNPAGDDAPPVEFMPGSRLQVTVSGPAPDTDVNLALRVQRDRQSGWTPHEPTRARPGTPADIDLSQLPVGTHTILLTAWTDGGRAEPRVLSLPAFTVQSSHHR